MRQYVTVMRNRELSVLWQMEDELKEAERADDIQALEQAIEIREIRIKLLEEILRNGGE